MSCRLFLFLLLVLTGGPPLLQAENVNTPLAVSEEMEIEAPVPLLERSSMLLPAVGVGLLLIGGGVLLFFLPKIAARSSAPRDCLSSTGAR
jgi:hypothetical protein